MFINFAIKAKRIKILVVRPRMKNLMRQAGILCFIAKFAKGNNSIFIIELCGNKIQSMQMHWSKCRSAWEPFIHIIFWPIDVNLYNIKQSQNFKIDIPPNPPYLLLYVYTYICLFTQIILLLFFFCYCLRIKILQLTRSLR